MRRWTERTRGLFSLVLLPLAACGDDGTSSNRLPAAEVAGIYQVCALTFTPQGSLLPAVDVRARAFELETQGVALPRLQLDPVGDFELEYTPRGRFTDVEVGGTFQTRTNGAILTFAQAAEVAPLLLPQRLTTEWDAGAQTLTVSDPLPYTVTKANYEAVRGEGDPGIPAEVQGTLSGRFRKGGACD